ncbi:MAG: hypothetical protein F6K47_30440 [Symploca sp. SIO2E6]|nr:hypothetical protein [Symploca sp. SIO2E6]
MLGHFLKLYPTYLFYYILPNGDFADDPDFDQKVQAAIQQKLNAARIDGNLKAKVVLEPPDDQAVDNG